MNRKILLIIIFISLVFVLTGQYAVAAESTGTRIKNVESNYQKNVLWFSEPQEITQIRLLLQEGKKELAVKTARQYVASLKTMSDPQTKQFRYFALNALCAALTSTGKIKEAVDACSRAIKLNSTSWQAFNTRGTAYYVSGKNKRALEDYRKALSLVQGSKQLVDLIQHNIDLAEKKKPDSK